MVSLHWHAFQLSAQASNKQGMSTHKDEILKLLDKNDMKQEEHEALVRLYGPIYREYFEASIAFLSQEHSVVQEKLEQILRFPIEDYPESNVRFIPGRVHDMVESPSMGYKAVFQQPRKLPPLPGHSNWHIVPENVNDKEGIDSYMRIKTELANTGQKDIMHQNPAFGIFNARDTGTKPDTPDSFESKPRPKQ